MKLRTPAELRAIAADATRDHRDPLQALYDAGRMDATTTRLPRPAFLARPEGEPTGHAALMARVRGYYLAVASHRQVRFGDIRGRVRGSSRVGSARHEVAWILFNVENLKYAEICRIMKRDHATTMNSVRIVEARVAAEEGLREELLRVAGADAGGGERVALRSVA